MYTLYFYFYFYCEHKHVQCGKQTYVYILRINPGLYGATVCMINELDHVYFIIHRHKFSDTYKKEDQLCCDPTDNFFKKKEQKIDHVPLDRMGRAILSFPRSQRLLPFLSDLEGPARQAIQLHQTDRAYPDAPSCPWSCSSISLSLELWNLSLNCSEIKGGFVCSLEQGW